MIHLRYTGTETRRTLKMSDLMELDQDAEDAQLVWEGNAPLSVPEQVWEAMQAKGLSKQFEIVDESELDAVEGDSIEGSLPQASSGSVTDAGNAPDDSSPDEDDLD